MPETEEFHNEECPEGCSVDHPVGNNYVTCEESGTDYVNCYECGWTEDYGDSESIRGRLYCNPSEHGFSSCYGCEEWYSDLSYHDGRDGYYCSDCYPNDYDDEGRLAESKPFCGSCSKVASHFDLVMEEYLCDCRLALLLQGKPFHPVKVHDVTTSTPPPPRPRPTWRTAPRWFVCTAEVNNITCGQPATMALTGRHSEEAACSEEHQRELEQRLRLVMA